AEQSDERSFRISNLLRIDESRRIEIAVDGRVRQIHRYAADAVGHVQRGVHLIGGGNAGASNIGREPAALRQDPVELPSAQHPVHWTLLVQPTLVRAEGKLIGIVEIEDVRNVKRRVASFSKQMVG